MERAVLYRRALAPVMLGTGLIGTGAAVLGWRLGVSAPSAFAAYWLAVAVGVVCWSAFIVRRQAFRASESFWSPPTRRVAQAVAPPLVAGLVMSSVAVLAPSERMFVWLPCLWMLFYGCALHAAGFFMPRGVKWLGWGFIVAGCGARLLSEHISPSPAMGHVLMGAFFGLAHVAYGIYLYFTEQSRESV